MAASNIVPERLINFRVYLDGKDCIGVADVDLPTIDYLKDTVRGAGVAGEVEDPIPGHFGSLTVGLTWRTVDQMVSKLAACKGHTLDIYGSQQMVDGAAGEMKTQQVHLAVKTMPKSVALGKFDVGTTTGSKSEFEVTYLLLEVGGEELVEIDKFNFIARFGGEDALESVRSDLGL